MVKTQCGYCLDMKEDVLPIELIDNRGNCMEKTTACADCRKYLRGQFRYNYSKLTKKMMVKRC